MHKIKPRVILSESSDPAFNLSLEEFFLQTISEETIVLILWQSKGAIVIGKNQNPLKECDMDRIASENIKLVRRLSGGGAVFHDLGNLNFSFVASEKYYDVEKQLDIILRSLAPFGIHGEFNGRNDLVSGGRKFSGNAFISEGQNRLHHGTLLIDSDMAKLSGYLKPSKLKIESKGFESVRSRVLNLKEVNPDITVDEIKRSIADTFTANFGVEVPVDHVKEADFSSKLRDFMHKYNSDEWNLSDCPSFGIQFESKFNWGLIELQISLGYGLIEKCVIHTDSIILENFNDLAKKLEGQKTECQAISDAVSQIINNNEIAEDIQRLICKNLGISTKSLEAVD